MRRKQKKKAHKKLSKSSQKRKKKNLKSILPRNLKKMTHLPKNRLNPKIPLIDLMLQNQSASRLWQKNLRSQKLQRNLRKMRKRSIQMFMMGLIGIQLNNQKDSFQNALLFRLTILQNFKLQKIFFKRPYCSQD